MSYHVFDNSRKTRKKTQENKKRKHVFTTGAIVNTSTFTIAQSVSIGSGAYAIYGFSISKS